MITPDLGAEHYSPHELTDLEIGFYLHAQGIVRDPNQIQDEDGELPAVYMAELPDSPDEAVAVAAVLEDRSDDDSNPRVSLLIVSRGKPDDLWGMRNLAADVFIALHERENYDLTAGQHVLLSRRISKGNEVRDQNRRWQRADTYRLRLAVPTIEGEN